MTTLYLDVAEDVTPHLHDIAAAGYKGLGGYLSSINPHGAKCWTPARVMAAAAAGLRIVLVHEGYGGVGGRGISAADGERDGAFCRRFAPLLGAPKGACIYFACDQDFSAGQIQLLVLNYFRRIRNHFGDGFYRVGIYGSGAVCAAVIGAGLADLSWEAQSKGWTGFSAWRAKASMVQGPEGHYAGAAGDTDIVQGDVGDYVPDWTVSASPAPAAAPAHPAAIHAHAPAPTPPAEEDNKGPLERLAHLFGIE